MICDVLHDKRGFTLIELLVVVSIISTLASVVFASLGAARDRGKEGAVKANLRSMMDQAELSYSSVIPNNYSTVCAGVAKMMTAITNIGGTAACYSQYLAGLDENARWGVSAKLNSNTTKNYSVDSFGIVTWDATDASGVQVTWTAAKIACANSGGRLPTFEQLKTLYTIYGSNPTPGFVGNGYHSANLLPWNPSYAYGIDMASGGTVAYSIASTYHVRCVR